jgi:pimeloyl-[acyl-carrier protein] synthase
VNRFSGYLARMPKEKQVVLRPFFENLGRWMTFIDDDTHRTLRTPVQKAFDSSILKRWEAWLERTTKCLVEESLGSSQIEFMSQIAQPLPLLLICEMLGIPEEDSQKIKNQYRDIVAFFDHSTDPVIAGKALQSEAILRTYMHQRIEHARSSSMSTLMTLLVRLQEEEADLSDDDIAANAILILGAGHETTTSLLGTSVLLTFAKKEWVRMVAEDESFRNGMIEEALRLQPPLQRTSRITRSSVEVDGVQIPAGERICLLFGAANRDPDVFLNPNEANPLRKKNPHLSFSGGPHFCAGARVARMEASILLRVLCSHAQSYSLEDAPLSWLENMTFRTLKRLVLTKD